MDLPLKSRLCHLSQLHPVDEIDNMLEIIFSRLDHIRNQFVVLRLLHNIFELKTEAGRHLLSEMSQFSMHYPIMVFLYHLCYITIRNLKHYSDFCPCLSSWITR